MTSTEKQGDASLPSYDAAVPASSRTSAFSDCSGGYIKTIPGYLKLAELALSIAALICGIVGLGAGGGWGTFVAGLAMAECIVLLVLHLSKVISRLPWNYVLWEFVCAIINAVMFLIAAIVCAVGGWWPPFGAYAFFGFAACIAFTVDAVLQYRSLRGGTQATTTAQGTAQEARY